MGDLAARLGIPGSLSQSYFAMPRVRALTRASGYAKWRRSLDIVRISAPRRSVAPVR
jgi:hypothetical protein